MRAVTALSAPRSAAGALAALAALALSACAAAPPPAAPGAQAAAGEVRVVLETAAGEIEIAADIARAPLSAGDFLRYVDRGLYDGAAFYRVVRADNDHGDPKIQVVQGGLTDESKALPPIAHETTKATGISHHDGTVSLARGAPGTGGAAAFFICVGDQPALDFGGLRNRDGLGFAAFGRVTRGMDVVRRIQVMEAGAPAESEYMSGQLAVRAGRHPAGPARGAGARLTGAVRLRRRAGSRGR